MIRRPPRSTRTDTLFPYTTLFRSDLAKAAGLSRFHFHRVFKEATGLTPKAYATAERAARLRAALPHSATVTEAIYEAGDNSSSRFYSKSAALLGLTPTAQRKSEERRVGNRSVGTGCFRWWPYALTTNTFITIVISYTRE